MTGTPKTCKVHRAPAVAGPLGAAGAPLAGLFVLGWGSNQFAPLLLFYPQIAPIGEVAIQGVFVSYVAALLPMLLLGGWLSDRIGRARVLTTALLLSALSSGLLLLGGTLPGVILLARVLSGVSAGIGFSAGTAWATESLPAPRGSRLSMVMMTAGLGAGPLVTGILAAALLHTGTPMPQVWVMIPHVLLALATVTLLWRSRQRSAPSSTSSVPSASGSEPRRDPRSAASVGLRDRRFWRVVVPLAPWTLICTGLPLATLPGAVGEGTPVDPLLFSAFLTPLPALGGICVQPIAGNARVAPEQFAPVAMLLAVAALGVSVLAVAQQSLMLLFLACLTFGFAHGFCQTGGLRIIAAISPPARLGRNTAVFQVLSYIGFLIPFPVALLAQHLPLETILLGILALAVLTFSALLNEARSGYLRIPRLEQASQRNRMKER